MPVLDKSINKNNNLHIIIVNMMVHNDLAASINSKSLN